MSNAEAWRRLTREFELAKRLLEGPVVIEASELKAIGGREPRLMAKFDTRESRPSELQELTILPLTNGTYVLLAGDGYADVPLARETRHWRPNRSARELLTLPWETGPSSESQAIDMANATGLLEDFLGDIGARLTIRGRLRSRKFAFTFDTASGAVPLVADGVQIEVDSGFEGADIHLIEAKLGSRTNFHIRQLYYPLRMWQDLVPRKRVTTVFMTWSNRCFSFRRFQFEPIERYHAIREISSADYYIDEERIPATLPAVLGATSLGRLPTVPFPQADDLRRVIDVIDAVAGGVASHARLAARYDFDERQAAYYSNAAAFLDFVERTPDGFKTTRLGHDFVLLDHAARQDQILTQLARRPVFRSVLEILSDRGQLPSVQEVAALISRHTDLSGATSTRRARTVLAWGKWAQQVARPA